jgi:putative cell wall-binding protein
MKETEEILGWGLNNSGQVGNGTTTHVAKPSEVQRDPLAFRISGQNRRETAINVAAAGWNYGAETVVLAREDDYPDALAGTPLAYALDAPILLTDPEELSPDTKAALTTFGTRKIIILGSTKAISAGIENDLKQNHSVTRIGGEDRYETAAAIARSMQQIDAVQPGKAILVNGLNFPDALAVSSPAAYNRTPVLLTAPNALPEITEETLQGPRPGRRPLRNGCQTD